MCFSRSILVLGAYCFRRCHFSRGPFGGSRRSPGIVQPRVVVLTSRMISVYERSVLRNARRWISAVGLWRSTVLSRCGRKHSIDFVRHLSRAHFSAAHSSPVMVWPRRRYSFPVVLRKQIQKSKRSNE